MQEVPVHWHEVGGSKVDLVSASLQMLRDIIVIRTCYATGIWADEPPEPLAAAAATGGDAGAQVAAPPLPLRFADGALAGYEEGEASEQGGEGGIAATHSPSQQQQKPRPLYRRAPLQNKRKAPARAAGSRNVPQHAPPAAAAAAESGGQRGAPPARVVAHHGEEGDGEGEHVVVGGAQHVPVEHPPPIIEDDDEEAAGGRDMR